MATSLQILDLHVAVLRLFRHTRTIVNPERRPLFDDDNMRTRAR